MFKRKLGIQGPQVISLGLGCMGIAEFYEKTDKKQAIATIKQALDVGVNYFDTADMYGCGLSESFLAEALDDQKNNVIVSSKFGFVRDSSDVMKMRLDARPEYVLQACNNSLKRLKRDHIDIYYLHRVDPNVPVEETIGAMKRLVDSGKIRHIGLSDTTVENINRAHKIHPISSYQGEYSLWNRDPEKDYFSLCENLGITFVPYSPLGRGFLTGKIASSNDFSDNDFRKVLPRFKQVNYQKNLQKLAMLHDIAKEKNCSLAQLSLAWMLHQSKSIVPIPGATHPQHVVENISALHVSLTSDEVSKINEIMPLGAAIGEAYPTEMNTH